MAVDEAAAQRRPVALLLLDVDGYRALRASRGEARARVVVDRLGARLAALEEVSAYRLGDDQFAVVVPTGGDPVVWLDALEVDLTRIDGARVSVGTARAEQGLSAAGLEQRALKALRAAKRRGDGSVVDAERLGPTPAPAGEHEASALLKLIAGGELRVHYQPIVELATGEITAFEALARPQIDHGLAGPAEAFAVADQLGMVPELDAVCRHSILAEEPGYEIPPHTRLHINVAPQALGHRTLGGGELRTRMRDAGLTPDRVVLEVSEGPSDDQPMIEDELRRLRGLGFHLALDDVGTSHASFRRLATGLFDVIKLSGALVRAAAEEDAARGVVEAVCAYARRTDAIVIAEEVENGAMLSYVRRLRTDHRPPARIHEAQGYALGHPRPQPR